MKKTRSDYWLAIARRWDADHPQVVWRRYSDIVNSDLIARWLFPSDRVFLLLKTDLFDEAFGKGLLPVLGPLAQNVIGIDISPATVSRACKHNISLSGITADLRHLPFSAETFDIVISNSSLDHFETRHEIISGLCEIHRVLKKGGRLILTLDNLMNPVIALRSILPFPLLNRSGLVPYYVGKTLSPSGLSQILKRSGFKIDKLDAVMHCPRVLAVAMARIFQKYAGIKTRKKFLRAVMTFERLSRLPTRFLTGYFVAAKAFKNKEKNE